MPWWVPLIIIVIGVACIMALWIWLHVKVEQLNRQDAESLARYNREKGY